MQDPTLRIIINKKIKLFISSLWNTKNTPSQYILRNIYKSLQKTHLIIRTSKVITSTITILLHIIFQEIIPLHKVVVKEPLTQELSLANHFIEDIKTCKENYCRFLESRWRYYIYWYEITSTICIINRNIIVIKRYSRILIMAACPMRVYLP